MPERIINTRKGKLKSLVASMLSIPIFAGVVYADGSICDLRKATVNLEVERLNFLIKKKSPSL